MRSNTSSNGNKNKIAGRDYHENSVQVDNIDSSQTININAPTKVAEDRPLVKSQRNSIRQLIKTIAESEKTDPALIWIRLHAEFGVNHVNELTSSQYKSALHFLNSILDNSKEKKAKKTIISKILRRTESRDLRQRLNEYCVVYYKTTLLDELSYNQLVEVIEWVNNTLPVSSYNYTKDKSDNLAGKTKYNPEANKRKPFVRWLTSHTLLLVLIFIIGFVMGEVVSKI
ncbi:hypothetical protein LDT72_003652 [Salmonella enterica]|nr:hypothetical protein [Salmonella enterica]EIE7937608.1 hypothetical protein [Salmonella enterica]